VVVNSLVAGVQADADEVAANKKAMRARHHSGYASGKGDSWETCHTGTKCRHERSISMTVAGWPGSHQFTGCWLPGRRSRRKQKGHGGTVPLLGHVDGGRNRIKSFGAFSLGDMGLHIFTQPHSTLRERPWAFPCRCRSERRKILVFWSTKTMIAHPRNTDSW
jgi:hypothetical protein